MWRDLMRRGRGLAWVSGLWFAPVWAAILAILRPSLQTDILLALCGFALAPVPTLLYGRAREVDLLSKAAGQREEIERINSQFQAIQYRTARLREELSAADDQARLSHQLTILGQFTAGFLHEFNNPLAILTNRIEVLLEERKGDTALCADLEQLLTEARYMRQISATLLPALRRQRGDGPFSPCIPGEVLEEVVSALRPAAVMQQVDLVLERADTPQVNLPAHVLSEVLRALISNALQALAGRTGGTVWGRMEEYHAAGSKVVLRIEDNGPGVPESVREHLFEPFVSRNSSGEHVGLGLFLAASLLNTHDGSLRYEPREGGGARFVIEVPPARFTRGQPYHWFTTDVSR